MFIKFVIVYVVLSVARYRREEKKVSTVGLDGRDNGGQFALVFWLHVDQSKRGSCLFVDNGTETSFAFDDAVWHTHLTAKSW